MPPHAETQSKLYDLAQMLCNRHYWTNSVASYTTATSKFKGHVTADHRKQVRDYGNQDSVSKNLSKVEQTLNKEERNKHVAAFPCSLERFFPELLLTPPGLVHKECKKDRHRSLMETPFSTCITSLRHSNDKTPNPNMQHPDVLPGKRYPALWRWCSGYLPPC